MNRGSPDTLTHPEFGGTSSWLRAQLGNPGDIFTVLLIVGGNVVQAAIAQLASGPFDYFVPVSFSFGWVSHAVSAILAAVGDNRLMPKPGLECLVINARSGQSRRNHSWLLARLLRDLDYWMPEICDREEEAELRSLQLVNKESPNPRAPEGIRIGLRVTVWEGTSMTGVGSGDFIYWIGVPVAITQLALAAIPWGVYGEWFTFMVTAVGTVLAYASAALPQWLKEKVGVRRARRPKDVLLTEGNGTHDVILILGCEDGLDLEALAGPHRDLPRASYTRLASLTLATFWIMLLISVAGWDRHTWYLLGVGIIGLLHNIAVAGVKRRPAASGLHLVYRKTIVRHTVMQTLLAVEEYRPAAGRSLLQEFFPAGLRDTRAYGLWAYADRRAQAWRSLCDSDTNPLDDAALRVGPMPPPQRPFEYPNDEDIPSQGLYQEPFKLSSMS